MQILMLLSTEEYSKGLEIADRKLDECSNDYRMWIVKYSILLEKEYQGDLQKIESLREMQKDFFNQKVQFLICNLNNEVRLCQIFNQKFYKHIILSQIDTHSRYSLFQFNALTSFKNLEQIIIYGQRNHVKTINYLFFPTYLIQIYHFEQFLELKKEDTINLLDLLSCIGIINNEKNSKGQNP